MWGDYHLREAGLLDRHGDELPRGAGFGLERELPLLRVAVQESRGELVGLGLEHGIEL